jgi:hypothetical protein
MNGYCHIDELYDGYYRQYPNELAEYGFRDLAAALSAFLDEHMGAYLEEHPTRKDCYAVVYSA